MTQLVKELAHEENIALINSVILADKNKQTYIILRTDNKFIMEDIINMLMLKDGWELEGGIATTADSSNYDESPDIYQALRKTNTNLYLWRDSTGKLHRGKYK